MVWEAMGVDENRGQWPLLAPDTHAAVVAHRGVGGPHKENTLGAFAAARAAGADGVELDVRRTKSGTPVVHHDPEVPGLGPLHLLEDDQLPPWLPTLTESLAACAWGVVDVEIKRSPAEAGPDPDGRLAGEVADLVAAALAGPAAPVHVVVSSFWPASLRAVRDRRPELPTGLLVAPAVAPADVLGLAEELGVGMLLPFRAALGRPLVEACHARGVAVWAWTVNAEDDLRSVVANGVDGVITDRVPLALAVLRGAPSH
jgi:glycerophosphoryl diester phosphodiesterase